MLQMHVLNNSNDCLLASNGKINESNKEKDEKNLFKTLHNIYTGVNPIENSALALAHC